MRGRCPVLRRPHPFAAHKVTQVALRIARALATFLLLLTSFALAVDTRAPAGWAGLMIGLSVTCLVLVFGPLTGAAVNPARAFGPFVGAAVFGGDVPWSQLPAYVIGSLLGGLAAALSYDAIARPRDHDDESEGEDQPPGEPQGAAGDTSAAAHEPRNRHAARRVRTGTCDRDAAGTDRADVHPAPILISRQRRHVLSCDSSFAAISQLIIGGKIIVGEDEKDPNALAGHLWDLHSKRDRFRHQISAD